MTQTDPSSRFTRNVALALALAVAAQGIILMILDPMGPLALIQAGFVTLGLAWATYEVWRNRLRIDHRIDMFLVMMAFGGLGMVIGTSIDRALASPDESSPHAMYHAPAPAHRDGMDHAAMGHETMDHSAMDHEAMNHGDHDATQTPPGMIYPTHGVTGEVADRSHTMRLTWAGLKASLLTWMTGLMLLFGIPPTWFLTRCATLAAQSRRRWVATHLLGNLGMVLGMIAAGVWFGHALGMKLGLMETGHHLAMLAGMLIGMELFQFVAEALLGLRPWRKVETGMSATESLDGSPQAR